MSFAENIQYPPSPSDALIRNGDGVAALVVAVDELGESGNNKQHSKEADELDFLCRKLSDVRVRHRQGVDEDDLRLSDVSEEQYSQMIYNISHSQDPETLRQTVIKFRKLLAHDDIHPYLQKIVDSGVIPNFVNLLSSCVPELQFEAAWILTNIAAGTSQQTVSVVKSDGLPALIKLISTSPYKEIREQSVWCIGNIAGDSSAMREMIVGHCGLDSLVALITQEMNEFLNSENFTAEMATKFPQSPRKTHNYNLSTLRIAIWALSNICRGNGSSDLDWNLIDVAMPILSQVITCCYPGSAHADDEIVMDACWAMSRTLRGIHEGISKIIVQQDVCQKLGYLITYDSNDVQLPALRCLINIVSGCDSQTQVVVDSGILPCLNNLLRTSSNETVRKETCLIISNITAGTKEQVSSVIKEDLIPTLVWILKHGDHKTKREACWAVGNATLNRDLRQISYLLDCGALQPLLLFISLDVIRNKEFHDYRITLKVLDTFKNILAAGDDVDVDDLILDQFNTMSLKNVNQTNAISNLVTTPDSAYSSMTNVFESIGSGTDKNPFRKYFLAKDTLGHTAQDHLTRLSHLKQDHGHLSEFAAISKQIISNWFS